MREIDSLKERHKHDTKELMHEVQLLNEKCETNVDKESYRRMNMGILHKPMLFLL